MTRIVRSLKDHDLAPSALVLQVTEGVLLVERGRQTLRELRAHGVPIAIDDFGTGYSSLSQLRQLSDRDPGRDAERQGGGPD